MGKSYKEITGSITKNLNTYGKESSDVMQAFFGLSKAATKSGAIDEKTKEFIALAIGIAKMCDGCIGFHTQKLIKLGATREEFMDVLDVAVYMGGGPSLMYAAEAISAYDEFAA